MKGSTKKDLDDYNNTLNELNLLDDWHSYTWDKYMRNDLKQFISRKFLLKYWEKDIIFNLLILSKCSLLLLFNVTFPVEIILFINFIYIELRIEDIGQINPANFCPCADNICLSNWYNSEEIEESIEDSKNQALTPFEINWNLYHCDGMNAKGHICHNIFYYNKELISTVQDDGFFCYSCNRTCCIECQANDNVLRSDDEERCYECHKE